MPKQNTPPGSGATSELFDEQIVSHDELESTKEGEVVADILVLSGEPTEIERQKIRAATLLARHWPVTDRRQAVQCLAGGLVRLNWPDTEILKFITAIAAATNDTDAASTLDAAHLTALRHHD